MTLVPTNTLELVEAAAARRAALAGRVEARAPPDKPLDVLVQHLVTVALGGGFRADELFAEVRTRLRLPRPRRATSSHWALDFVERGGDEPRRLPRLPPRRAPTTTASAACPTAASRSATA